MHEIVINLHMHTRYSDGTGTHKDIADAAIKAGLDAVIVTDHNVLVQGVERNSPAGRAGLRQGDVVVSINGERVETSRALVRSIAAVPPGQTIRLGVLREGRERELPVQVGRRPGQG